METLYGRFILGVDRVQGAVPWVEALTHGLHGLEGVGAPESQILRLVGLARSDLDRRPA